MIFENNYAYAGTTAIIYNVELEHSALKFYIDENNQILLQSNSMVKEIGIEYKKESEDEWNTIKILNETTLDNVRNGTNLKNAMSAIETSNYLYSSVVALYKWNHMSPIRIVIKNLEEGTTYNIRSYYIKTSSRFYWNSCTVTTLVSQNVHYECTEVTGGTEEENAQLLSNINKACDIYNSMTAFTRESPSSSDKLNSKTGGKFTATIIKDYWGDSGFVADSSMKFKYPNASIGVICHEMAHNTMKRLIDDTASEKAYNEIVKFMEFATHCEGATWRWQSNHNYPVISSKDYQGVFNYLVAAACYVCRSASDRI